MSKMVSKIVSKMVRVLAVVVATAALALGLAGVAYAHVTVSSSNNTPGGYATLTFKVPTESDTASTTGLTVQLPSDSPFTSVLTQPVPGWTVQVSRAALPAGTTDGHGDSITSAVTAVSWTATGDGIKRGEFGTFALSVGPLPAGGTLYLPAVQHYSDGTEVSWVQQAQGNAEPDHPAPSVQIASASPAATAPVGAGDRSGWALGLGIGGVGLALVASALAGAALARGRRAAAAAEPVRPEPLPATSGR